MNVRSRKIEQSFGTILPKYHTVSRCITENTVNIMNNATKRNNRNNATTATETTKTVATVTANTEKQNTVLSFTDIEKTVATLCIGSKCSYTKYNDNKNGYIGVKYGNKNVFSMFGLKNENATDKQRKVGCTDTIFKYLKTVYTDNVQYTENGNSNDKTRNNLIETTLETVLKMYQSVITHLSTATETK